MKVEVEKGFSLFLAACTVVCVGVLALGLCTWKHLAISLLAGGVFWVLKSRNVGHLFSPAFEAIENRPQLALFFVIALGVVMRLGFAAMCGFHMGDFQIGDSPVYIHDSIAMSRGGFPDAKSWLTIFGYSLAVRAFGKHLIAFVLVNLLLDILVVCTMYAILHERGVARRGIFAGALYFLCPFFGSFTFFTYSEHYYYLLVLLAFYGFVKWIREQRTGQLLLMCTVIPFVFLTKPDAGLICTVALLLGMAVESVRVPECCGRVILGAVCLLMVVVATLLATRAANMHFHGSESAFCSNDNYWPRLFGLNYKTSGRCNNEDKEMIRVRYKELTGKSIVLRSQRCPVELIPLIKAEMSSRVRKMSMLKFVKLIFRKQQYAWTKTLSGSRRNSLKSKSLRNVIDFSKCVIFLLGIFSLLRLMFTGHGGYLRMLIILYIVGIVMMLSIAESNSRYCAIIGVFVPLLFGLAMDCSTDRTATRKALVRRGSSDSQIAVSSSGPLAKSACPTNLSSC